MKYINQKIMLMLLLLTISNGAYARNGERDPHAAYAAIQAQLHRNPRVLQGFIRRRQRHQQRQYLQVVPADDQGQKNYTWHWYDKTILAGMGACLAYFAAYTFLPSVKSHLPHPDYAFAAGSAGMAAWFAHKAYTARCENSRDKLIKSIVGIGAISSAFYALDFMLRSKV